jgi:hypothetical protein
MAFILCALCTQAQADSLIYKAFKVNFGFGTTYGDVTNTNFFVFSIEPNYQISNRFSLGVRYQAAGIIKSDIFEPNDVKELRVNDVSFCLTADYYFLKPQSKRNFRVFGGIGSGVFNQAVVNSTTIPGGFYSTTTENKLASTNFGFFPRVGVEVWHLRTWFDYDITGGSYHYNSFNLAFFFGGGLKRFKSKLIKT